MHRNTRREFLITSAGAAVITGLSACGPRQGSMAPAALPAPRVVPSAGSGTVAVSVTLNERPAQFRVHPDDSALAIIRQKAGLTGAKMGCGQGVCGACTMLVDGTPVATCLLPATSLEGRECRTVEGLG